MYHARIAPESVARMTSLTVPPCTRRILRYSFNEVRTSTTRRCAEGSMLNGDSGVDRRLVSAPAIAPTLAAAPPTERPKASVLLRKVFTATLGLRTDSSNAL